ncbi:hypothetical protein [Steroidobacter agaridevorans]|uniref:hypothetical protein n=1 Tax=Steroidobacter agaridevorans TaxID=2695856 RepID=UPI00137A9ED2|nr:hypothetical protein [Steroidobacter agaridevorans]
MALFYLAMFHNAGGRRRIAVFPANIPGLLRPLKCEAEKRVAFPGFLRRIYRIDVI